MPLLHWEKSPLLDDLKGAASGIRTLPRLPCSSSLVHYPLRYATPLPPPGPVLAKPHPDLATPHSYLSTPHLHAVLTYAATRIKGAQAWDIRSLGFFRFLHHKVFMGRWFVIILIFERAKPHLVSGAHAELTRKELMRMISIRIRAWRVCSVCAPVSYAYAQHGL